MTKCPCEFRQAKRTMLIRLKSELVLFLNKHKANNYEQMQEYKDLQATIKTIENLK